MRSLPGSGITVEEREEPEAMDYHQETGFWHNREAAACTQPV